MRRATPRKQRSGSEVAAWGHIPHHGAGQLDWLSRWLSIGPSRGSLRDMCRDMICGTIPSLHHTIGRAHHADYAAPCLHGRSIGMAKGVCVCVLGGALEVRSYKWLPINCCIDAYALINICRGVGHHQTRLSQTDEVSFIFFRFSFIFHLQSLI